jgi:hypothetical protein
LFKQPFAMRDNIMFGIFAGIGHYAGMKTQEDGL